MSNNISGSKFVRVYDADNACDAHLMQTKLNEAGIGANITGEPLASVHGSDFPSPMNRVEVIVRLSDVESARELITEVIQKRLLEAKYNKRHSVLHFGGAILTIFLLAFGFSGILLFTQGELQELFLAMLFWFILASLMIARFIIRYNHN